MGGQEGEVGTPIGSTISKEALFRVGGVWGVPTMFTILKLIPHSRQISLQLYPPPCHSLHKKTKKINFVFNSFTHRNNAGNYSFDI